MKLRYLFILSASLFISASSFAQDDAMKLLSELNPEPKNDPVQATFKSTRLINLHTIEVAGKRTLDYRISHRFGPFSSGSYNAWGLDGGASIRMGLEYSYDGRLQFGIGRSSVDKMVDGFAKYRLLRQNTSNKMPVSVTLLSGMYLINTRGNATRINGIDKYEHFSSRLSYAHQVIVGRKFNERFSLQLAPTLIHFNQVDNIRDHNDVYALALATRYKLTRRLALTYEYTMRLNEYNTNTYYDSMGIGIDIETGGHVFQLHFTNSIGMTEPQFVAQTSNSWSKQGMRLGFNISRAFTL